MDPPVSFPGRTDRCWNLKKRRFLSSGREAAEEALKQLQKINNELCVFRNEQLGKYFVPVKKKRHFVAFALLHEIVFVYTNDSEFTTELD